LPGAAAIKIGKPISKNLLDFPDGIVLEKFLENSSLTEQTQDPLFELWQSLQLGMDAL
jgi:hypothetical protein